jgi:hypothetical protein
MKKKVLKDIVRWFGMKIPVVKLGSIDYAIQFNSPKHREVWSKIKEFGIENFHALAISVKKQAMKKLMEIKEKKNSFIQSLPTPKLRFPRKQLYQEKFPNSFIRINVVQGNFHTARFFGIFDDNQTYEDFIKEMYHQHLQENGTLQEFDEEISTVLANAKILRQHIFGEVFRGRINKLLKSVFWTMIQNLLQSRVWIDELSNIVNMDFATADEVVFIPKKENSGSQKLVTCAEKLQLYFDELFIGHKKSMPVRVEVCNLELVEINNPAVDTVVGLHLGRFIWKETLVYNSRDEGKEPLRLKVVPKNLYLSFYKLIHGLHICEEDYFFTNQQGLVSTLVEKPIINS